MILLKNKLSGTEGIALDYNQQIAKTLCVYTSGKTKTRYILVKIPGHHKKRWRFANTEVIGTVDSFDFNIVQI